MNKACFYALILICLAVPLAATPGRAAASGYPALTGRVVDEADLFTPEQEEEMISALADFEDATTIQYVVAAVRTTGDQEIQVYATDLFNRWELGQMGKDNGALLCMALEDRQFWIVTGYGIEDRLTDARCGDIYRKYIKPHFQRGLYYEGTMGALKAMMQFGAPDYSPAFEAPDPISEPDEEGIPPFLLVLLLFLFVILGSIGNSGRSRRYWGRRGFSSGGGFWGGGFGGGFGGGGFSGGGGRSGGGGAGGGW